MRIRSLILPLVFLPLCFLSQTKKSLTVFTFDEDSKKPLKCDHYHCDYNNGWFQIFSDLSRSAWLFEKQAGSHFLKDYKTFSNIKTFKKGYMPEVYDVANMKKATDTINIYMKKMFVGSFYSFKNIYFKEDLTIDEQKSKYFLNAYKEYLMAKNLRLKIVITTVRSLYATSEENKTKAAYNLRKFFGFDNRIQIKIENGNFGGPDNEVVFNVLSL